MKIKKVLATILIALAVMISSIWIGDRFKQFEKEKSLQTIEVNGVSYKQKSNVDVYMLMGIDHMDEEDTEFGSLLGDNDLNLVLIVDHNEKTWQLLQINRDTMTNVIQIDAAGKQLNTIYEQICLAHSYGDGKKLSCQNVVNTVSNLLWNQYFDGYVSVHMQAVNDLADAVGGVPVHVEEDFSNWDSSIRKGDIVLDGSNALNYVRGREYIGDSTNESRQKRQREFMNSFINQVKKMNVFQIVNLYVKVKKYIVTDISTLSVIKLAKAITSYEQLPLVSLEGISKVNTKTNENEYKLINSSLQSTILTLFYDPQ